MEYLVAPLVGAWIEIRCTGTNSISTMSLPSWERGLKSIIGPSSKLILASLPSWERGLKCLETEMKVIKEHVAPLVGAWIEI